jgi:hypothetical protein
MTRYIPATFLLFCLNATLLAQCPPLEPISGPASVQSCVNTYRQYTIPNSADANLVWSVIPPSMGNFQGSPTGQTISIFWYDYEPSAILCATPTNPCYDPTPVCLTVEVAPIPYVICPDHVFVCAGDAVYIPITGSPNTEFLWTCLNPAVGLPGSGSGDIAFIAANVNMFTSANILLNSWQGTCQGLNESFGVYVYPRPTISPPVPVITCGGAPVSVAFQGTPGADFLWTNDNPAIGLAASGSGNISFNAAPVTQTETAIITVTPSQDNVHILGILTCTGDPVTFTITVKPTPTVDDPPDLSVCCGEPVAVAFSGSGSAPTYAWTNSLPAIGLPASGTGNISFSAANPGASPLTATISVQATQDGCTGPPQAFAVTVKPIPAAGPQNNRAVCAGQALSVALSGTPAGTTFTWENSNPAIGLPASGSGNINFTAAPVAAQETATITYTPVLNGCVGPPASFQITVNPLPVADPLPGIIACAGDELEAVFSGSPGSTYAWENSNTAVGLGLSGTGNINFTAANVAVTQSATVTVTPTALGCAGPPMSFGITVRPRPVVTAPDSVAVCPGDTVAVALTGSPGATLNWINADTAIGLGPAGVGNILFVAAPVTDTTTATVTITPVAAASGCVGQPVTFAITVNKCCATSAGTLDTATVTLCGPDKIISLNLPGNHHLEPGDTLRYILYANPANPLGSIVQYSDTLLFHFLPDSMQLDSAYFVGVLAGPLLAGDSLLLNAAAKCFSLHKGPRVRWVKKPAMSVALPPEAVCGDGCVDVQFDLAGTPPFEFTWHIMQNGQVLLSRDETVATGHQHTVMVCPQDFDLPAAGNELVQFRVVWLTDRYCGCGD